MNKELEIAFYHGWGFDSSCWAGWLRQFEQVSDYAVKIRLFERGYFGRKSAPGGFDSATSIKIVIGHSFGLHQLPSALFQECDLVLAIGAFATYHFGDSLSQRRSRRTLRLMKERLKVDPLAAVDEFHRNCYHPLPTSHMVTGSGHLERIDPALLLFDLDQLDSSKLDLDALGRAKRVVFLHGAEDTIVSRTSAEGLSQSVRDGRLSLFEGAGHALPFTHVTQCWLSAKQMLTRITRVRQS